jgi:hypothetical protein
MSINGIEINKKSKYIVSIYNPTTGDIGNTLVSGKEILKLEDSDWVIEHIEECR